MLYFSKSYRETHLFSRIIHICQEGRRLSKEPYGSPNQEIRPLMHPFGFNTLRLRQHGRHDADEIFTYIYLILLWGFHCRIFRRIQSTINHQLMVWCRTDQRWPSILKHICITRPLRVNTFAAMCHEILSAILNYIWPVKTHVRSLMGGWFFWKIILNLFVSTMPVYGQTPYAVTVMIKFALRIYNGSALEIYCFSLALNSLCCIRIFDEWLVYTS